MFSWFDKQSPETETETETVVEEPVIVTKTMVESKSFNNFVSELKQFQKGSLKRVKSETSLLNKEGQPSDNIISELKKFYKQGSLRKTVPLVKPSPKPSPFVVELAFHREKILKLSDEQKKDEIVQTTLVTEVESSLEKLVTLEKTVSDQSDQLEKQSQKIRDLETEMDDMKRLVKNVQAKIFSITKYKKK